MSPILDANGQPLPSANPEARLGFLNGLYEATTKAGNWGNVETRFEQLLTMFEPQAENFNDILMGKSAIDARGKEGREMVGCLVELAYVSLILRHRGQREAYEAGKKTDELGGTKP